MMSKGIVRFIDKAGQPEIAALLFAKVGMAYSLIRERTGLTNSQIASVLRYNGVKLSDYRKGESPTSKKVVSAVESSTGQFLRELKGELTRLKLKS